MHQRSDDWRLARLERSLSNPNHPFHRFSTGNLETLKTIPERDSIDIRGRCIEFHARHYSANRMKLCVLGREPLDVLEKWVAKLFAEVPNKDLPQNRWDAELPWTQDRLCKQVCAKPIMDLRQLKLSFPFMDLETLFETQPSRYISHLIEHEGPGSIMSYIKSKGWATTVSAGANTICPGTPSVFDFQVDLTEEGLVHYKEIVKVFFEYVALLRKSPPQEWIFDEMKHMADLDFKYKQETRAIDFTSDITSVMQKPLPRDWLLNGECCLRMFDPELIKLGLDLLRPDNFRMTITSRKVPGDWDQKEQWYGTEYKSEDIPGNFLAELEEIASGLAKDRISTFHLPGKNQFIPTKLEVEKEEVKGPAISPKLLRNDTIAQTWYKKDETFRVPKANLIVSLQNPVICAPAGSVVKAKLFTDLVKDALEQDCYYAEVAGLSYDVNPNARGLFIKVSGYNDKLPVLLEKILIAIRDLEFRDDRFGIVRDRVHRAYQDWELKLPYLQAMEYPPWLTEMHRYIPGQLALEAPHITADGVRHFSKEIISQLYIQMFAHGNIDEKDVHALTRLPETTLKPHALPDEDRPIFRSLIIPPGSNFLYSKILKDPANVNHCIEYYLYVGSKVDYGVRAKTQLLWQILHEAAFDQFNTQEQLGYITWTFVRASATTYGLSFLIQSEEEPGYLESRIDAFLGSQGTVLETMSRAEFEDHKWSVVSRLLEKPVNLDEETARHWDHIDKEDYDFASSREKATHVKQLTKEEMIAFYQDVISPTSVKRAKLAIHLLAQGLSSDATKPESSAQQECIPAQSNGRAITVITDVRDFKASLAAIPGAQSVQPLSDFQVDGLELQTVG
ncbi:peptidase M16 inactive domain-containing protein [Microdochium bolleyi]|uniref:Peptidase M16 inactive domain-containing protein n=1 Tax=Microdochium bolleyi TaxID=196109 RepID=A0A136IKJ7_9PEZI|nr:peptidase M16 inactive domain-containing protein [Microdochium bolleyi]